MPSAFPTKILLLAAYFQIVIKYLQTNAARLGIDSDKLDAVVNLYGDNATPETYLYNYALWCNKVHTKTSLVNQSLASISKKLKKMLAEIYNDIPATKWKSKDRKTLNRKNGLPYTKTTSETKTKHGCSPDVVYCQNAVYKFLIKVSGEAKRCGIPEGMDSVEMAYAFIEGEFRKNTELNPKVRKTCLGPDDDTLRKVSFKAIFYFETDIKLKGYEIYIWFRYVHSRHPELAGKWSNRIDVTIV